jgi:pimeloyl-ACP methyl ester carboxylesterase
VASLVNGLLNRCTGPWFWATYYSSLYKLGPAATPDLSAHVAGLKAHLGQPGRLDTLYGQLNASKARCEARMPELAARRVPALGVWGSKDPDFASPVAEAELVTARLNAGGAAGHPDASPGSGGAAAPGKPAARHVMIEGAGHYPHVEAADAVAAAVLNFANQFA